MGQRDQVEIRIDCHNLAPVVRLGGLLLAWGRGQQLLECRVDGGGIVVAWLCLGSVLPGLAGAGFGLLHHAFTFDHMCLATWRALVLHQPGVQPNYFCLVSVKPSRHQGVLGSHALECVSTHTSSPEIFLIGKHQHEQLRQSFLNYRRRFFNEHFKEAQQR